MQHTNLIRPSPSIYAKTVHSKEEADLLIAEGWILTSTTESFNGTQYHLRKAKGIKDIKTELEFWTKRSDNLSITAESSKVALIKIQDRIKGLKEQLADLKQKSQQGGGYSSGGYSGGARTNAGMLWYVDKTGKPAVARVKTGLTDGQTTEITPRDSTTVQAGMPVIVGTTSATASMTSASSANPLQPQSGQRRGGPGGF